MGGCRKSTTPGALFLSIALSSTGAGFEAVQPCTSAGFTFNLAFLGFAGSTEADDLTADFGIVTDLVVSFMLSCFGGVGHAAGSAVSGPITTNTRAQTASGRFMIHLYNLYTSFVPPSVSMVLVLSGKIEMIVIELRYHMSRFAVTQDPFVNHARRQDPTPMDWSWPQYGDWPAKWIDHPDRPIDRPSVALFQLDFEVDSEMLLRLHVSADNRYMLAIDGQRIGLGPERGDALNWYYESHEVRLAVGKHRICALSWWLGDLAPWAQCSLRPGFLLAAEGQLGDSVSTGIADWKVRILDGLDMVPAGPTICTGARFRIDANRFPTNWMSGLRDNLVSAVSVCAAMCAEWKNEIQPGWLLLPAMLPAMLSKHISLGKVRMLAHTASAYPVDTANNNHVMIGHWQALSDGSGSITLPANTKQTVLFDLDDYACFYAQLCIDGGKDAQITIKTAEALFNKAEGGVKENRDKIEGMYFTGEGDIYIGNGQNIFMHPLWWQAGRYIELTVSTKDEPLTIVSLSLEETRYPIEQESTLQSGLEQIQAAVPIMVRAEQMCMHETYMDCPYYEQYMYVGDTRLEALVTHVLTHDDRLPKKALVTFDQSRRNIGLTQSRYPSRITQVIPPFSLWWVCMAHDYLMWRNDPVFVRSLLPGARAIMEYFRGLLREDGLIDAPRGWNFVDWVDQPLWITGVPFTGDFGTVAPINLQMVLALQAKAEIERAVGDELLAERDESSAKTLLDAIFAAYWSEERQMIADDLQHKYFSEHSQCLAILSGLLDEEMEAKLAHALLNEPVLARTTIYYTHYLFETYRKIGATDAFIKRLDIWNTLKANGFRTTFETPEPSRSDCHAWGAHPLYHIAATIAGIRPAAPGFQKVLVQPLPGAWGDIDVRIPHPNGWISVQGTLIVLPEGVTGEYVNGYRRLPLNSGMNRV